jgi:hypothetical protein
MVHNAQDEWRLRDPWGKVLDHVEWARHFIPSGSGPIKSYLRGHVVHNRVSCFEFIVALSGS